MNAMRLFKRHVIYEMDVEMTRDDEKNWVDLNRRNESDSEIRQDKERREIATKGNILYSSSDPSHQGILPNGFSNWTESQMHKHNCYSI